MKVTAEFNPQAWVNDNAIDVDPEGPRQWDATAFAQENLDYVSQLLERKTDDDEVLDNDDVFQHDPAAPEWVREWHGPFSIYLNVEEDENEIHLWLEIENVYEDGDVIVTHADVEVPAPPALGNNDPDTPEYDAQAEWEQDYIFPHTGTGSPHTGTGREEGDSAYFVTVNKSTHPDAIPVDTRFEFGL